MDETDLRNDSDSRTKIMKSQLGDVQAVNGDLSAGSLDDAEQTECERGLAGSCAAYDTHLQQ